MNSICLPGGCNNKSLRVSTTSPKSVDNRASSSWNSFVFPTCLKGLIKVELSVGSLISICRWMEVRLLWELSDVMTELSPWSSDLLLWSFKNSLIVRYQTDYFVGFTPVYERIRDGFSVKISFLYTFTDGSLHCHFTIQIWGA